MTATILAMERQTLEQQHQILIENLDLELRRYGLNLLPSFPDEYVMAWMVKEKDKEISFRVCEEWLKRHPEC